MPLLYAITLFVSATLLFLVQPMIAKMVLPLLGGTPAVWNTCMLFFQAALLLGYAYAHALTNWLRPRAQVVVHGVLLLLPFLFLPLSILRGGLPPSDANPILWLLWLLCVSVGSPFFVLSTSAPLLQKWFVNTGHPSGRDPYFLYAASNLGSMLSLVSYPALIEPNLPLKPDHLISQSWLWAVGYGLFVVCMAICGWTVWTRSPLAQKTAAVTDQGLDATSDAPTWRERLHWIALAFVPSSLMLGATTHITLDIAAVPLLWVIPLGLYLLSFILVFAKWPSGVHMGVSMALPLAILLLLFIDLSALRPRITYNIALHLLTLFLTALVCHGELARRRPSTRYLTQFYLLMSLGGVLGGIFNALVAPVVFSSVAEYPIALALACFLVPPVFPYKPGWLVRRFPPTQQRWVEYALDVGIAAGLGLISYFFMAYLLDSSNVPLLADLHAALENGLEHLSRMLGYSTHHMATVIVFGLPTLMCYMFNSRPLRFGLGVAALMAAGTYYDRTHEFGLLHRERSFFGVLKVEYNPGENSNALMHGTTLHGKQFRDPDKRRMAITYYDQTGPIGQLFETFSGPRARKNAAFIGLGSGTLASYGTPGMHITYYDIDPAIVRIAQNPEYFTFLQDCQAEWQIKLGDARLKMAEAPDHTYDLIIVDAFSSDAIPIHLITREAVEMYRRKLTTDGILVVHISNRYLNLEPVIGNLAKDLGMIAIRRYDYDLSDRPGKTSSDWMIMANHREDLGPIDEDTLWGAPITRFVASLGFNSDGGLAGIPWADLAMADEDDPDNPPRMLRWRPAAQDPRVGVWTDDFSNLLSVFMW